MRKAYVWHGHPLSYFSMKLDAALRFYDLPYEKVEIGLGQVLEPVRKRAGTHLIPVLETPEGWALWDTTPILFLLDGRFPDRAMFGEGLNGLLVHVIENFLDEWLGRTMVHYRWHYEACAKDAALRMAAGNRDVAKGIAVWGAKACRATGVETAYQQDMCEAEYARILQACEQQLSQTRYLMGDAPCAVDAVILGGLRAHTMNDPVPAKLVAQFPRVVDWVENQADVRTGRGRLAPVENPTGFARAMLDEMQRGFMPFALASRRALAAGEKVFTIEVLGGEASFLARPYPEEACQMVRDHAQRLRVLGCNPDAAFAVWGLDALYSA